LADRSLHKALILRGDVDGQKEIPACPGEKEAETT
jgi:hypothetical protein